MLHSKLRSVTRLHGTLWKQLIWTRDDCLFGPGGPGLRHFNVAVSPRFVSGSTSPRFCTLRMTEGVPLHKRVRVQLHKDGSTTPEPAHFTQSLIDYLAPENPDGICQGTVELRDNNLHISTPQPGRDPVKLKRPAFCPIHNLSEDQKTSLPPDIYGRGVDCGAAVILEAGDGRVLLTRRADHLRTFPSIWVPPGGHIEQNETLAEAGLRELHEETGLLVTPDMCINNTPRVLAVWESTFPPKLSLGLPKRHHAVVYLYAQLRADITSESLQKQVNIDPSEVGALAWFDRDKIDAIVAVKEEKDSGIVTSKETVRCIVPDSDGKQTYAELPFGDLLKTAGDEKDQKGRVSTGTKFALEEWTHLK